MLRNRNLQIKKYVKYVVVVIVFIGVLLAFRALLQNRESNSTNVAGVNTSTKVELKAARAHQDLNKDINIEISGIEEEDGKVTMQVENAELRDEIVVQGQKASSVSGRTFLVLNLKLTNGLKQAVEINTRDYLRLAMGEQKDEWLAPDIHNDPVAVQAISTKPTRVAFPIDDNIRHFVLAVGAISGDKENIELNLQ
jgi:hypothetical protein